MQIYLMQRSFQITGDCSEEHWKIYICSIDCTTGGPGERINAISKQVNRKKQTGVAQKSRLEGCVHLKIQEEHRFSREGRVPVNHLLRSLHMSSTGVGGGQDGPSSSRSHRSQFYVVRTFVSAYLFKHGNVSKFWNCETETVFYGL